MHLFSSSYNTIYHNNFNNTQQVERIDLPNIWDDGSEGNYWSDYNGTDTDLDGIGNIAYHIDENNIDRYPLAGMYHDFDIALDADTYRVSIICNSTLLEFRFGVGRETGNKMIHLNITGKLDSAGFCRITIPTGLMNPHIILFDLEEIEPTKLDELSNETYICLYFTYAHTDHSITIISSRTLSLYYDLVDQYKKLNATYYDLLVYCDDLFGNYSLLQDNYWALNSSYYRHLDDYGKLYEVYQTLNATYYDLLVYCDDLFGNYSLLQDNYWALNSSYYRHLDDYSQSERNLQNLIYMFAATAAIFVAATTYLSKHAHSTDVDFPSTRSERMIDLKH